MTIDVPPLYDKEVTCDICNCTFFSKKIRSRFIRVKETWNDFYSVYKDQTLNPLLYDIYVCHQCGYAFSEHFNKLTKTAHIETFKNEVSTNWTEQNFSNERTYEQAVHTYKLAILAAKKTVQPHIILAGLCLRLSWIYRTLGNLTEERRYIQQSLLQYEQSLIHGDYVNTNMTELTITYLIGELARQADQSEKALKYFSSVIEHKDRMREPKIIEKARDQWYLAREGKPTINRC